MRQCHQVSSLSLHLIASLLVSHLEVGRPKPDLTAAVADPVDHQAGEHGETFKDFEQSGGGEESRHVSIVTSTGAQYEWELREIRSVNISPARGLTHLLITDRFSSHQPVILRTI